MTGQTTRRALIGGAGLTVIAAAVPTIAAVAVPSGVATAWAAAMATVERERARDAVLDARHSQAQADGTLTDELETEWDQSANIVGDAEWALFMTGAPDLTALEWKFGMIRDRQLYLDEDIAATFIADIRHLRGEI